MSSSGLGMSRPPLAAPPCRLAALETFRVAPPQVQEDVYEAAAGQVAGVMNLEQHGGSFGYRHSSCRTLFWWGRQMGLEVFPGSPVVYKHFIAFRILCQGVSSATLENDFITISVLHSAFREKPSVRCRALDYVVPVTGRTAVGHAYRSHSCCLLEGGNFMR
mmetsp:Transcript_18199/g.21828  ORF Transcript_18199/g.21828 Transcript_18199/m.21828 type:complete len:162 (+) Transcript_18199:3451-3936(+)